MNALKRLKTFWAFALVLPAAALPALAQSPQSYCFVRILEGSGSVVTASSHERADAEINQPVLAGDRLQIDPRSRAEAVLADRSLIRVDGGTDLVFERLAASPDSSDRRTVLRLLEGNIQLVVDQDTLADDLPRIETPNATVTIEYPGIYRITAERDGWTQVVARRGSALVESERGSERVRADEELIVEDGGRRDLQAEEADGFDSLERWAARLDSDYGQDDRRDGRDAYGGDESLRYAASSMDRYGDWISVEGRSYWHPRGIDSSWRPYWHGRWAYTPSGLTWVSSEPWGWVPYHYGTWDYLPTHGWVWQAGSVFSPAWVYWYWGNDYAGWCPTGYYTRYYSHSVGAGFRFGVYGWANAGWDHYRNWNFIRFDHFGRRDQDRYAVPIDHFRNGRETPGRGIITTDTRALRPDLWRKPQEAVRTLSGWEAGDSGRAGSTRPGDVGGTRGPGGKAPRELPDVTGFISRKPLLSPTEVRTVSASGNVPGLDGSPLKPATLGRLDRGTSGRDGRTDRGTEVGSAQPRWSKPAGGETRESPLLSGSGEKPVREGANGGNRSPRSTKPATGSTGTATWRDGRPGQAEIGGGSATETPSWRKPSSERPAEPPTGRKPSGGSQNDSPSWRKPTSGAGSGASEPRDEKPTATWRNRDSGSERPEPRAWSKPAPSGGDAGGGYRSTRPVIVPPSGSGSTYRTEPSKPSYRVPPPSGGSSSGGSSSGGSTSVWQAKPQPSGDSHKAPAPAKAKEKTGNGGGDKPRARSTRPPNDGDPGRI